MTRIGLIFADNFCIYREHPRTKSACRKASGLFFWFRLRRARKSVVILPEKIAQQSSKDKFQMDCPRLVFLDPLELDANIVGKLLLGYSQHPSALTNHLPDTNIN